MKLQRWGAGVQLLKGAPAQAGGGGRGGGPGPGRGAGALWAGAGLGAALGSLGLWKNLALGASMAQLAPGAPSGWHFGAKVFPKLFQKHEREHSVGHEADPGGQEALDGKRRRGKWKELGGTLAPPPGPAA